MLLSNYETHQFPNPLLPFIYHPFYCLNQQEIDTNWHKNIEILCCFQGKGYVRCGGEVYDFTENDIVVVNSDLLHTVGSNTCVAYCCFIVGSSFCIENGIRTEELVFHNVIRDGVILELMKEIARIHNSFDSRDPCAVADYRYAALGILRRLCREHSSPRTGNPADFSSVYIKKAITYIRSNLTKKLSLDDIADHIGISKFYLSREFKKLTGNTVVSFINILRCSEAKRLMEKGMSVSSAAYACGFENLSYFSRTFQRIIGVPPSSYTPKNRSISS